MSFVSLVPGSLRGEYYEWEDILHFFNNDSERATEFIERRRTEPRGTQDCDYGTVFFRSCFLSNDAATWCSTFETNQEPAPPATSLTSRPFCFMVGNATAWSTGP